MNEQKLKEMKRYLLVKNSAGGCVLVAARIISLGSAAGALACYISCITESSSSFLLPAVLLTILALFFHLLLAFPNIQAKKEQQKWLEACRLEEMVADFETAKPPVDSPDLVRLGNIWIFGHGCGKPVEYNSIRKLQIQTLKMNGVPLETTLFATLDSGKSVPVCREIRKSQPGNAIAATIIVIKGTVPNVQEI